MLKLLLQYDYVILGEAGLPICCKKYSLVGEVLLEGACMVDVVVRALGASPLTHCPLYAESYCTIPVASGDIHSVTGALAYG